MVVLQSRRRCLVVLCLSVVHLHVGLDHHLKLEPVDPPPLNTFDPARNSFIFVRVLLAVEFLPQSAPVLVLPPFHFPFFWATHFEFTITQMPDCFFWRGLLLRRHNGCVFTIAPSWGQCYMWWSHSQISLSPPAVQYSTFWQSVLPVLLSSVPRPCCGRWIPDTPCGTGAPRLSVGTAQDATFWYFGPKLPDPCPGRRVPWCARSLKTERKMSGVSLPMPVGARVRRHASQFFLDKAYDLHGSVPPLMISFCSLKGNAFTEASSCDRSPRLDIVRNPFGPIAHEANPLEDWILLWSNPCGHCIDRRFTPWPRCRRAA